ncbi:MAG: hypothetical protein WB537_02130, partial [Pseudolabrys sp.]
FCCSFGGAEFMTTHPSEFGPVFSGREAVVWMFIANEFWPGWPQCAIAHISSGQPIFKISPS